MKRIITWGILGTGDIARQMAEDLRRVPHVELRAVASRNNVRADAFAHRHAIPVAYGSYQALVEDPAIDVVYVATPHSRHCEDALLCFQYGKSVLCEKPLALNCEQADQMIAAAKSAGCFLMEAIWTAFFPAIRSLRNDIAAGKIGAPRLVVANFSYRATASPDSRIFNPELGGGALMDIGVYTIALADMVFGEEPKRVYSAWTPAATGVDASSSFILDYGDNRFALLCCSLTEDAPQEASIAGTEGVIRIPHQFSQPDGYTLKANGSETTHNFDRLGYGYHLEAQATREHVAASKAQCSTVPWAMSRRILRTTDRIRAQWNLRYAGERVRA